MDLQTALKKLKQSKEFKELNKNTNDIYFSYALIMLENNENTPWKFGYYHKSTDKMITFLVEDEIKVEREEDIFKKPGMEIKPLNLDKAKIPYDEILKIAQEFQKKKYPKELVSKTIAILQNLEEYGNIWNITYVTLTFKTLNMKINAETGNIIDHNLQSLMDFVEK